MEDKLKKISKQYNLARNYSEMMATRGFRNLKEFLEKEIENTAKYIIYPGYEKDKETEVKYEAKAYKKLLLFLEGQDSTEKRLKDKIKELKKNA